MRRAINTVSASTTEGNSLCNECDYSRQEVFSGCSGKSCLLPGGDHLRASKEHQRVEEIFLGKSNRFVNKKAGPFAKSFQNPFSRRLSP